jgi:hypothetical protein
MLRPPVHPRIPAPLLAAVLMLLAAGLACTFLTPTPVAWSLTPTGGPSPQPSATAPLAAQPAPAGTAAPSAIPSPLPTAAVTASPTASAGGPWLVYARTGGSQVVAREASGASVTPVRLSSPVLWPGDLSTGASPADGWLAVRTGQRDLSDLSLDLIQFPGGVVRQHIALLSESIRAKLKATSSGLPDAVAAASQPDALRWSADGRWLAFVGAMDGPSADLYLFDTQTQQTARLTEGLNQVASPIWSPDGLWVVFQEVISFSANPGWKVGAVWAAATDHHELRKLYMPPTNSTGEGFLTWGAPDTLLVYTRAPDAIHDVRSVPISARFVTRLYNGPLDQIAFDPKTQNLAFSETDLTGAGLGLAPGVYLLPGLKGAPQFIRAGNWGALAFSASIGQFLASGDQGLLLFSAGGSATLLKDESAGLASPDGHWLVCWGTSAHPGLRLYRPDGTALQEVTADLSEAPLWQPDSKAFDYLSGAQLFQAAFPQAQPAALDQGVVPGSLGWLGGSK